MKLRIAFSLPLLLLFSSRAARADEPATDPPPSAAAKSAYARSFVGFDEAHGTAFAFGVGGGVVAQVTVGIPYLGVQHDPLGDTDFYDAVDRPDLSDSIRTRHRIRIGGEIGGWVLGGASFVLLMVAGNEGLSSMTSCYSDDPGYGACMQRVSDSEHTAETLAWTAGGAAALSAVGFLVHHYLDEDPVSELTRRNLVRQHNARLKRSLGLPDDYEITPIAEPGGGGLALSGRF